MQLTFLGTGGTAGAGVRCDCLICQQARREPCISAASVQRHA